MFVRRISTLGISKQFSGALIPQSIRSCSNISKTENKAVVSTWRDKYFSVKEVAYLIRGGVKDIISDYYSLMKLKIKIKNGASPRTLTSEELRLYFEFRNEIFKILPVLTLAVLPFGNFLAVPLALINPKKFLTSHFWSDNQKLKYQTESMEIRVPVFKNFVRYLVDMAEFCDYTDWKKIVNTVKEGNMPETQSFINCKHLFRVTGPYYIERLGDDHLKLLFKSFDLTKHFWRDEAYRLQDHASYIYYSDIHARAKGVDTLMPDVLRKLCYTRGVNPYVMTEEEMKKYLTKWLSITKHIDTVEASCVIFLVPLLALNHPSNRQFLI